MERKNLSRSISPVYTCIDLFCGCGGFSLGVQKAGLKVLAGIDVDPGAIAVYRRNLPEVPFILEENLRSFSPAALATLLATDHVDVIIGGPPCQGYSTVRQVDGANSGPRTVKDSRRHLYKVFLRFVQYFRPSVFVMENVIGIKSAQGGKHFANAQQEARRIGYRVHSQTERASDLGVPQKRLRQLIIGTRSDCTKVLYGSLRPSPKAIRFPTLGHAICDLPPLKAGEGTEESDYDLSLREDYIRRYGREYLFDVLEVDKAFSLNAHRARPHSERDLRDFVRLREGEHCAEAIKRGEKFEFPYSRNSFKDRYTRQHRDELCSTIVAHLSKDGLMFIHPTQNRSLTPREAARVQSFPDWFMFPVSRTQQFRLIGNAVPPLVGEAVGLVIKNYLSNMRVNECGKGKRPLHTPVSVQQASEWLSLLLGCGTNGKLHNLSRRDFLKGWSAIGYLAPFLHPDGALEHGEKQTYAFPFSAGPISHAARKWMTPCYVQSGWPIVLNPIAKEAWRRFKEGSISERELYFGGVVYQDALNTNSCGRADRKIISGEETPCPQRK